MRSVPCPHSACNTVGKDVGLAFKAPDADSDTPHGCMAVSLCRTPPQARSTTQNFHCSSMHRSTSPISGLSPHLSLNFSLSPSQAFLSTSPLSRTFSMAVLSTSSQDGNREMPPRREGGRERVCGEEHEDEERSRRAWSPAVFLPQMRRLIIDVAVARFSCFVPGP